MYDDKFNELGNGPQSGPNPNFIIPEENSYSQNTNNGIPYTVPFESEEPIYPGYGNDYTNRGPIGMENIPVSDEPYPNVNTKSSKTKKIKSPKPPKTPKQPKATKGAGQPGKKSWFTRILVGLLLAILFGCVAGVACYGISYAGFKIFPIDSDKNSTEDQKENMVSNVINSGGTTTSNVVINKDLTATIPDYSEIVENVITSVVAIECKVVSGMATGTSGGTGFIIDANSDEMLIVTNAHVVDSAKSITVQFHNDVTATAEVKGMKAENDVAVLSIKAKDLPANAEYSVATIGDSKAVKVGETAIVIGNALGNGISVTTGCISALNKSLVVEGDRYDNLIQTEAAINQGNSGGAMFNAKGEVIGIPSVTISSSVADNMGYAISISSVSDIIDKLSTLIKQEVDEAEQGYLGITGYSITNDISAMYGYPVGVLISEISDGSGALDADLQVDDIITHLDGVAINGFDKLKEVLKYHRVGDTIDITVMRLNRNNQFEKISTQITLGAKPD